MSPTGHPRLVSYGTVAAVLLTFLAAYVVNASRLRELGTAALRSVADAQWSAYQAEFELHRLLMAVDGYALGDGVTTRAGVIERIDILWSRLPPLVEGSESRLLQERTAAAPVVSALRDGLEQSEDLIRALPPGAELRAAVRAALEPQVGPLHGVVLDAVHATNARQAELQRRVAVLSENHLIAMLGVIGATLVLGGLLMLEIRRVRELLLEAAHARDRIVHLAHHDSLTGLPNRRLFDDRLAVALARSRRTGEPIALHLIDVDGFKQINDRLGHAGGDGLLVHLARRLRACIRDSDTFARLGGDELAVLQVGPADHDDACSLARRLIEAARHPLDVNGQRIGTTVSIGVALAPCDGQDPATVMRKADEALYVAKSLGRNRFALAADRGPQRLISTIHSGPEEMPNVLAKSP